MLSPMLFNAALEQALRNWKARLSTHGLMIDTEERLTNVRFADDLIIYASSLKELIEMLDLLTRELL